jgi:hypothetical protein
LLGSRATIVALLHNARPVLLNLGASGEFNISPWADRVRLVDAGHTGEWELPVLGKIARPSVVLIRPARHVARTGHLDDPQLPSALTSWFGEPSPA